MKKLVVIFGVVALIIVLAACNLKGKANGENSNNNSLNKDNSNTEIVNNDNNSYKRITMDEAQKIFETEGDYIILDVRRPEEYAEGHIPRAINIANETIGSEEISELPDKEQLIYVYCRSGNRSKQAAGKLVDLGYTNIVEFGGIMDWKGKIEK